MRAHCYQSSADGLLLFIKLTPSSAADEILGIEDGPDGPQIRAKVHAAPDRGKANKALIALISKWLDVAKSDIALKRGGKSRLKTLSVDGNAHELEATLETKLAG